jgi:hypothetical protein
MNTHDEGLERIATAAGELTRAIEPERDLWPGIEARIAERPSRARAVPRRSRAWDRALAAGIGALTVGALFFGLAQHERSVASPEWAYEQLDSAYRPLRQASLERYRGGADRLDPQLRAIVESNLAVIDGALTEIRVALASRPGDAALRQMLQRTYEQELALIDAVTPPRFHAVPLPRMDPQDQIRYRGTL